MIDRSLALLRRLVGSRGGLVGLALAIHLVVLPIRRPLILPDEAGFILNSYQLIGDQGPSGLGYYPGYSLLLAPVASLTSNLRTFHIGVQIVNAALVVCTALLAAELARSLHPGLSQARRHLIALVTVAYPAYVVFGAFALSENLLVPVTLALAVAAIRAITTDETRWLLAVALLGGFGYAIHARAIALPVAALVVVAYSTSRSPRRLALGTAAVVASAAVAFVFVESILSFSGIVTNDAESRHTVTGLLRQNADLVALRNLPLTAAGQAFYLSIASAGLVPLGLWKLWSDGRSALFGRDDGSGDPATIALAVTCAPMLAIGFGTSILFLNEQGGDQAIYGRYNEGLVAPLFVLGAIRLVEATRTSTRHLKALALLVPALAVVLVVTRGPEVIDGRRQLLNITGVYPIVDLRSAIELSVLTVWGLVVLIVLGVIVERWNRSALPVVLLLFVAIATYDTFRAAEAIEALGLQDEMLADIEEMAATTGNSCVALDQVNSIEKWHQENYRLELSDLSFEYWWSDSEEPPCSDLVISPRRDLDTHHPGAGVVAVEPYGRQMLWVLPGPTQWALEDAGVTVVRDPDRALITGQQVVLTVEFDRDEYVVGSEVTGTITVLNQGPDTLFPEGAFPDQVGSVNIGFQWRDPDAPDEWGHEPFRLSLDRMLTPGTETTLPFRVPATTPSHRLGRGDHILHVELVQEMLSWTGIAVDRVVTIGGETAAVDADGAGG